MERVCSQTQLCQLRCFNDCTILDNYMFQPLLAIFRLPSRELKVLTTKVLLKTTDNLKMASRGRNM